MSREKWFERFVAPLRRRYQTLHAEFVAKVGHDQVNAGAAHKYSVEDLAYMNSLSAAVIEQSPRFPMKVVKVVALFLAAMIIAMSLSQVDIAARGAGKVIPPQRVQVIQSLEGGVVSEILVREGDPVEVDQPLVKISDVAFSSSFSENRIRVQQLRKRFALINREIAIKQPLVERKIVSEVELLQLQRQASEIESELLGAAESGTALQDRVDRAVLQSPVKGTVKRLHINTVGGVVKPGSDIMEIVPREEALLIEVEIKPADIAHISVGQKARVKFSAYDFAIYGSLEGEVNFVGADTVTNEKGESYYIVRISPYITYLGTETNPLPVKVGMVADVDILTGKRTILQYLMKPIFKAKDNALIER